MYHASFIRFCERGRSEFLRSIDITCTDLDAQIGTKFVVRHLECDYFKPALLDHLLSVETCLNSIKNTSFIMDQSIFEGETLLFNMKVTLVCVDKDGKPQRVPNLLRDKFSPFLETTINE